MAQPQGPNRWVWLAIVGSAVLIVAAAWTVNTFFGVSVPGRDTTPVTIKVLVAPSAYEMVLAASKKFNNKLGLRPIVVTVVRDNGDALDVLKTMRTTAFRPPTAWVAEASWSLAAVQKEAPAPGFAVSEAQSVARSYLMWGMYASRSNALATHAGEVSWTSFHDAVAAGEWRQSGGEIGWGRPRLALANPKTSAQGVAAVLAAASDHFERETLTAGDFQKPDFQTWLSEALDAVPSVDRLGNNPARVWSEQSAIADSGFILESDLLWNVKAIQARTGGDPIQFTYPSYTVVFDFPFAVWNGAPEDERAAASLFREFLRTTWQADLPVYGLRPLSGPANGGLFADVAQQGIQADPALTPIEVPADVFNAARALAQSTLKLKP